MREARRLALIEKQALIAEITRKQALRSLAEALEAETRSNTLAARSRALVGASAPVVGLTSGAGLAGRAGFTAALAQLATTAGSAASDAARQSQWQAEALATAENRARRLTERAAEARAALDAARARAAQAEDAATLARKLQNKPRG